VLLLGIRPAPLFSLDSGSDDRSGRWLYRPSGAATWAAVPSGPQTRRAGDFSCATTSNAGGDCHAAYSPQEWWPPAVRAGCRTQFPGDL